MTPAEEEFVHLVYCSNDLNDAWSILHDIKVSIANPLVGAAFRYALIAYARAYVTSHGDHKRYKLTDRFIPDAHRELHQRLITARHSVHAHTDLTIREAGLFVINNMDGKSYGTIQNVISGMEELQTS